MNFFQPSRKLVSKVRVGARVKKKYDLAQTPYQRLINTECMNQQQQTQLKCLYESLNPIQLQREISRLHKQLSITNRYNLDEAAKNTSVT